MSDISNCGNCFYYLAGECRKKPIGENGWPRTGPTGWCGKWEPEGADDDDDDEEPSSVTPIRFEIGEGLGWTICVVALFLLVGWLNR